MLWWREVSRKGKTRKGESGAANKKENQAGKPTSWTLPFCFFCFVFAILFVYFLLYLSCLNFFTSFLPYVEVLVCPTVHQGTILEAIKRCLGYNTNSLVKENWNIYVKISWEIYFFSCQKERKETMGYSSKGKAFYLYFNSAWSLQCINDKCYICTHFFNLKQKWEKEYLQSELFHFTERINA